MGTKNDPGRFDCYTAAEDDEPMFVLLARDPIASVLVELWAHIREMNTLAAGSDDTDKCAEAHGCAADMERWRIENRDGTFGTK